MTKATTTKELDKDVITLDRRNSKERRQETKSAEAIKGSPRKQQRRRHIDPTTCERDYNEQEIEFMHAMDAYKRSSGRMFPTCSEVLEVIRSLGYVQLTAEQLEELSCDFEDEQVHHSDLEEELEAELADA